MQNLVPKCVVMFSDEAELLDSLASLACPESSYEEGDEPVSEQAKENSPNKPQEKIMKSPVNRFAVKSYLNKGGFDLNAKKTITDVKSRWVNC